MGTPSTLTITVYSDALCTHSPTTWPSLPYSLEKSLPSGFRSYKLSRSLLPDEQLDFSTSKDSAGAGPEGANDDQVLGLGAAPYGCAVFTMKARSAGERGVGCHEVGRASECVNLWVDG